MKTFLILLFVHFLLDWSLQDEMIKKYKSQYDLVLAVHCIIWSFGLSIALMYFDLFEYWKLIMLFIGHYCMDYWKCRGLYKKWFMKSVPGQDYDDVYVGEDKVPRISDIGSLYIDQTFHVIQVFLCLL